MRRSSILVSTLSCFMFPFEKSVSARMTPTFGLSTRCKFTFFLLQLNAISVKFPLALTKYSKAHNYPLYTVDKK